MFVQISHEEGFGISTSDESIERQGSIKFVPPRLNPVTLVVLGADA